MIAKQIERIKSLKRQQLEINSLLKTECKPKLTAKSAIPSMTGWLLRECQESNEKTKIRIVLFVICAMFAPVTLASEPLPRGLRSCLSKTFKIKGGMVSYYLNGLYLYYERYKSFRNEVDRLLEIVNASVLPNI